MTRKDGNMIQDVYRLEYEGFLGQINRASVTFEPDYRENRSNNKIQAANAIL